MTDTIEPDGQAVIEDGILDLRPPSESLKAELCRLGLSYSYAGPGGETWADASRGVQATIDDGDTATISDVRTNLNRRLTLDEIRTVTRIDTMTKAGA